MYVITIFRNK